MADPVKKALSELLFALADAFHAAGQTGQEQSAETLLGVIDRLIEIEDDLSDALAAIEAVPPEQLRASGLFEMFLARQADITA